MSTREVEDAVRFAEASAFPDIGEATRPAFASEAAR